MNAKIFIVITVLFLAGKIHSARCQETADSLSRQLQEVVVTANQPATRLVGSTIVSTIAGSGLANLGTALDVLAQLPMIRVTDNTVSVIGKNDVEIFIDGRPMRDSGELQTLLSSNLKKVELLMAPGAAYESTTDAVLKITTRRNIAQGLSLTDRFELQRRRKWSVTEFLGVSYRTGGWEMFAEGSVNRSNSIIKGTTTNTLVYDGRETVVGSRQYNSYPATAGVVKAGFNYAKGTQMIGAYYRYNPERGDFTNNGAEWLDGESPLRRDITRKTRAHSHLASVYYENSFAGRYLLHFDGDFRRSDVDCLSRIHSFRCQFRRPARIDPLGREAHSGVPALEREFQRGQSGQLYAHVARLPHAQRPCGAIHTLGAYRIPANFGGALRIMGEAFRPVLTFGRSAI